MNQLVYLFTFFIAAFSAGSVMLSIYLIINPNKDGNKNKKEAKNNQIV